MKQTGRFELRLTHDERERFASLSVWLKYDSVSQMIRDVIGKLYDQVHHERSQQHDVTTTERV